MPSAFTTRAAFEKAERELREQAGPLVTEEQLERILSISSIADPGERVKRLNEIYDDLQRQAREIESSWRMLEAKLDRMPSLPADQQQLLDELHAEAITGIRAEAAALLVRDTPGPGLAVPRRIRMTI